MAEQSDGARKRVRRTPEFQASQILLEAVSKDLYGDLEVRPETCHRGRGRNHAQLKGEGTGEDGGQEDSIPANDGPKQRVEDRG